MPLVEHELLTLPEYMSLTPFASGVRLTPTLVLCVSFVDHCLSFCPLCCLSSFELRILTTLWYLQALPKIYLLIVCCLMCSGKYFKQIQNENKINNIIKLNMKEKYDNQVKGHRLPPGQGSSTSAGKVWKAGDASGSSVGRVLETVIKTIYLKIIYLLNIYDISLSGDWLLYKGIPYQIRKV